MLCLCIVAEKGSVKCDCSDTMFDGDYCEIRPNFCKKYDFNCFNDKCNTSSLNPTNPCESCPDGYRDHIEGHNHTCKGNGPRHVNSNNTSLPLPK